MESIEAFKRRNAQAEAKHYSLQERRNEILKSIEEFKSKNS